MHDSLLSFFKSFNDFLALPSTILFFGVAVILSVKTGFIQIRYFHRFIRLITHGVREKQSKQTTQIKDEINPFQALFAALATSIGMGNIVGPTVAIAIGGPGALFWMLFYMFFASVTKFTEVTFALHTRIKDENGQIVGGPMVYLQKVSVFLAYWYAIIMAIMLVGWSGLQSNNLSNIYALENVPHWVVGLALALFTGYVLSGGAQRVAALASKLVPFMFFLYVSFAFYILFGDLAALRNAFALIFNNILTPATPVAGFLGASVLTAMRLGVFRGIFISEAGVGTSSIPHAMSDAKNPVDQGILAMGSTLADMTLSILSGLLVLVTGMWTGGQYTPTLVYQVFKMHSPVVGQMVLLVSVSLFVLTTVIGNSFNSVRSVLFLTKNNILIKMFTGFTMIAIFLGALMPVPLAWEMTDTLLVLVVVPHLLGLLYLAFKYPDVMKLHKGGHSN